jgi:small subunit ribosomal protein S20
MAASLARGSRLVRFPSGMANIKSQIKRNKTNEKRRLRNKAARSEIKTRVKVAVTAAAEGPEEAADALRTAVKRIDKAAAKGIIHKNQAANRKSRLMRRIARQTST